MIGAETLPATMKAVVIEAPGWAPSLADRPTPHPGPGDVVVRVEACGVCRTDLHVADGELAQARYPIVPGHQVAGVVAAAGEGAAFTTGDRVGVPWLGGTCGSCPACRRGDENLCENAEFTGCTRDGGFAEYVLARSAFCLPLPEGFAAADAAPLLCGGLIGYRALRLCGDAPVLGIYGFGSAAHVIAQVALHQGRTVAAFVRDGDATAAAFARSIGVQWAGDASSPPPQPLDAAIIFAPAGELVPLALAAVRPGGTVVCGGIHMSDIPSFPYRLLWGERVLRSVANLTRDDGRDFLRLAAQIPVRTSVEVFDLADAGQALNRLREGSIHGSAVLIPR